MKSKNPILMAAIGAAHGIKGQVRVRTFTGDPKALGDYGPLASADGRVFTVADIRPARNLVIVRFREIADRNAAEAANGLELFIDRSALPEIVESDEFYHADLIGLAVCDETGATIGTVDAFHDFGGGEIMDIATDAGGSVLVPFSEAAVPAINIASGKVTVDRRAAGLIDSDEEQSDSGHYDSARRGRGPRMAGGNR